MAVALKYGISCRACTADKCVTPPSDAEPLCIPRDDGTVQSITQCPYKVCDPAAIQAVKLAGFMREGMPPVAGGVLDQAKAFMTVAEMIWDLENGYRARK